MSEGVQELVENYFGSLHARLDEAVQVDFVSVSFDGWQPRAAECHANADYWTARHPGTKTIRGWLIGATDGGEARLYIAHSILDDAGTLLDITPSADSSQRPPFLIHRGTPEEFEAMRFSRASQWYPPNEGDLSGCADDALGW